MLISPRTYTASQIPDRGPYHHCKVNSRFYSLSGWHTVPANDQEAVEMLLIHQVGSVRVGEVVRYTITYTPTTDTVRPIPAELYVKVKNTSAAPLRAAYLHGPYTLYTSCYPSAFDPNVKLDQQITEGIPQFEPYLKAGGSWSAVITVPRRLRQIPEAPTKVESENCQRVTWVIEIMSQIVFSSTASVNFELLVGRDQNSVELSSTSGGLTLGLSKTAAQLCDHWSSNTKGNQVLATKGVYSTSISLLIDDTASLWNTPALPSNREKCKTKNANKQCDDHLVVGTEASSKMQGLADPSQNNKRKRIHLVVLTHGLHSNLGADMLYLKESIDTAARKSKEQADKARQKRRNESGQRRGCCSHGDDYLNCSEHIESGIHECGIDTEDEQVIVRGFPGNAVRTERGIQYLGKRLARYVLLMTYPNQFCTSCQRFKSIPPPRYLAPCECAAGKPSRDHIASGLLGDDDYTYEVTSISFVGHSLGGLIQTYAIAYIQKHFSHFFDTVKPVNFIALATPFLGLSNENPMYIRFALDLGLVGRTGQDLGLSWTAPRVRSGWEAIIGGKGNFVKPQGRPEGGSKPLLRILPCGPAHEVLAKFQHRTIYSNMVNDGIVPLRTSCLLFLDWKGLERVEKARRENGIVGTMAEWGWAELTGANSKSPRTTRSVTDLAWKGAEDESDVAKKGLSITAMPSLQATTSTLGQVRLGQADMPSAVMEAAPSDGQTVATSPLSNLLSFFRPKEPRDASGHKQTKILKRSQTLGTSREALERASLSGSAGQEVFASGQMSDEHGLYTPPKTTIFESASDILMPPIPPIEYIIDPTSRPRTIFHDRLYCPEDIPPPLVTKKRTLTFGSSQSKPSKAEPTSLEDLPHPAHNTANESESGLKVEEKIARAYHRDLTWRKVLVRLEPDAHNNIVVRRMFTNAYGWPVVKHLVDTHFGHMTADHSRDNHA
ncbi:putative serine esterase-domain-containing protein [Aspergillus avenaceus]|uniref:Putative serine esterase-domain-containing protein n=1 Tax=Aspergillus avenaceus TaxID=36643 RepID=A0A5N6TFA0_ASPAV|nr:putative serine esterase-domain-containing protein [Aspergillus avenaceus]